jgi:hypothetical protein
MLISSLLFYFFAVAPYQHTPQGGGEGVSSLIPAFTLISSGWDIIPDSFVPRVYADSGGGFHTEFYDIYAC